ncbi:MAG: hypothetical protein Q9227_001184 [Pyrenula ochraceoflavens]
MFGMPPTPAPNHTSQPEDYGNMSPSIASIDDGTINGIRTVNADGSGDDPQRARSSSEEKDNLTPAQSRRKMQNRAAQRAFRERKERHVKDLEQKLTTLEQTSSTFAAENERLKREIAKISTENEILRATNSTPPKSGAPRSSSPSPPTTTGPQQFTPTDLYTSVLDPASGNVTQARRSPNHRIVVSEKTGERLLAAGATWDMILAHEMYEKGLVDVGDVCERLKKCAKCDGQGPVFEEGDIRRAIEASVAGGSDRLI